MIGNYLHANVLLPIQNPGSTQREDTEQNHIFRLEQPLPWLLKQEGGATRAPLTLAVEYQIISAQSNIKVFQYNRSVLSVTISYQY